jgi:hypothetical protein
VAAVQNPVAVDTSERGSRRKKKKTFLITTP